MSNINLVLQSLINSSKHNLCDNHDSEPDNDTPFCTNHDEYTDYVQCVDCPLCNTNPQYTESILAMRNKYCD